MTIPAGVPDGVKVLGPPEGVDPDTYWSRVRTLRYQGMTWWTASRIARQEAVGAREPGGPLRR